MPEQAAAAAAAAAAAKVLDVAARAAQNLVLEARTTTQEFAGLVQRLADRIDKIDTSLDKMAESLQLLTRLDERIAAHNENDKRVEAVVSAHELRISKVELSIGPLLEMRKWIIAAVIGIVGTFTASVFNAGANFIASREAARELPVAAKRVEDVLVTPQFERSKIIQQRDSDEEKARK